MHRLVLLQLLLQGLANLLDYVTLHPSRRYRKLTLSPAAVAFYVVLALVLLVSICVLYSCRN